VAATTILTVFELSITWFLGSSAIAGAALGFGFALELRHDMVSTNEELIKQCIEPAIEAFHSKHNDMRKPEFYFDTSAAFSGSFKFRLSVPEGETKSLYVLKPELSEMIINQWDEQRKAK